MGATVSADGDLLANIVRWTCRGEFPFTPHLHFGENDPGSKLLMRASLEFPKVKID
jgi:hypothetical protein